VDGSFLVEQVTVSVTGDFEIALTNTGTYTGQFTIIPSDGLVTDRPVYVRFRPTQSGTRTGVLTLTSSGITHQVNLTGTGNALPPELTVDKQSLAFGSQLVGGVTGNQIILVNGAHLTDNVTVTVSSDFQIATSSGGTFGTLVSLNTTNESVANAPIYVRFAPSQTGVRSGTITIESSGIERSVDLSGTGTSNASIQLTTSAFNGNFGATNVNSISTSSSYTVSASGLSSNLIITAPDYFRVSLAPTSGYSSSLSLPHVSGTIANTTVYVVFAPGISGALNGNITHTTTGASQSVFVEGVGAVPLSVEDVAASIKIHPNPTDGYVEIAGVDWTKTTVRIFDSRGYRLPVRFKEGRIDVSDFPAGMYYFTFSGDGQPVVHKVVIR
jgi:hypothetical protein